MAFGLLFNILINNLICTFLAIGFLFSRLRLLPARSGPTFGICVGSPAQFWDLTSQAPGGVSEVGLLAVGPWGSWGSSHAWRDYHCYLLFVAFGLLFGGQGRRVGRSNLSDVRRSAQDGGGGGKANSLPPTAPVRRLLDKTAKRLAGWCVAGAWHRGRGESNLSDLSSSPHDFPERVPCDDIVFKRSKVTSEPIASRPYAREEVPRPTEGPQFTPCFRAVPPQPTSQFV